MTMDNPVVDGSRGKKKEGSQIYINDGNEVKLQNDFE